MRLSLRSRPYSSAVALAALCIAATRAAQAQTASTVDDSARVVSTAVFTKSDLHLAEGFVVAAAASMPFDERLAHWLQRPALHQTASVHNASTRVEDLALPGAYLVGYGLYGMGALAANEPTLSAGFHTAASVIVASHVGDAIKALVGRTRPSASTDAQQFAFGAGFSNASQYSFPSGHTTVAFAAATAISEELNERGSPAVRYIAPVLYTSAALVGVSRMYNDAHWASDVIAGAAVGTFTARLLVREAYAHPHNLFDLAAVHAVITADRDGRALIGWSSSN